MCYCDLNPKTTVIWCSRCFSLYLTQFVWTPNNVCAVYFLLRKPSQMTSEAEALMVKRTSSKHLFLYKKTLRHHSCLNFLSSFKVVVNHKFGLLQALIDVGAWSHAETIISRFETVYIKTCRAESERRSKQYCRTWSEYSRGLNTKHSNNGNIWIANF